MERRQQGDGAPGVRGMAHMSARYAHVGVRCARGACDVCMQAHAGAELCMHVHDSGKGS